jgi:CHASE3 domain sensor protein
MREHGHASKLLLQHLTPGVIAAFIAAVLVLIVTIVLGFRSVQRLYLTHESIAVAYQTRIALDQVLATLLNAETGERGYIITNNPSYLDPYTRAREAIDSNLAQMRRLMADDPDQQADYEQLSALATRKLAELELVITLRRDGTFSDAQVEVAKHLGKTLMDDMRIVVARMVERENARLRARTVAADRAIVPRRRHVSSVSDSGCSRSACCLSSRFDLRPSGAGRQRRSSASSPSCWRRFG